MLLALVPGGIWGAEPSEPFTIGTAALPWQCDSLPPVDFSHVLRVYCKDAAGNLVTLKVEHVDKGKR